MAGRVTEDPSVLSWMIVMAPRPRAEPTGRHWWRELVTSTFRDHRDARDALRESSTVVNGHGADTTVAAYQLEDAEFDQRFPKPTLRAVMVGLSQGSMAP
jgi:hypothetical protein